MGEQKAHWKTEMNKKEMNSLIFSGVSQSRTLSVCATQA